jgi:hypothetical protein
VIMRIAPYELLCGQKNARLSDNTAASATAASPIGVDRSGGRGLRLGGLGGDGEECSEEIHLSVFERGRRGAIDAVGLGGSPSPFILANRQ